MKSSTVAASLALAASASASASFVKRDSWGPAVSLGPAAYTIVTTETTIYPGEMPSDQAGLLYHWLGMSNGTGDLIQSIIGSYPAGQSECSGTDADTAWCISSEVYGNTDAGVPNQWVGDLRTADANIANGIVLNYTLVDESTWLWTQTMTDAVTGTLLSSFNKTSGPMLGWGTAVECNDDCTPTISTAYYRNSTIVLSAADPDFTQTLGASSGATYTTMETADEGLTWTIEEIMIPAMDASSDSTATAAAAAVAATSVDTGSEAAATSPAAVVETTAVAVVAATSVAAVEPETTAVAVATTAPVVIETAVPTTFASVVVAASSASEVAPAAAATTTAAAGSWPSWGHRGGWGGRGGWVNSN